MPYCLGTKAIDANTGLIYFKYDFGYEFGIIFPGEGRKYIAGCNKFSSPPSKQFLHNSAGCIDIPVSHEKTIKRNLLTHSKNRQNNLNRTNIYNKSTMGIPATISFNIDDIHAEPKWMNKQQCGEGALIFFFSDLLNWRFVLICFFFYHTNYSV